MIGLNNRSSSRYSHYWVHYRRKSRDDQTTRAHAENHALLQRLVARYFNPQEVATVTGGVTLGAAFALLPFDLLFFTGSTSVGQKVMEAAAKNLTPVVLELAVSLR